MAANQTLIEQLNNRLARLYRQEDAAIAIAESAGINTLLIDTSGDPLTMWFKILDFAFNTANNWNKIIALLEKVTGPNGRGADADDLKGILENLKNQQVPVEQPQPIAQPAQPSANEKDTLEKLMEAKSTLLPISFLEQGLTCANAVVRIKIPTPGGFSLGTGFVIDDNYLVTNNHVIGDIDTARKAVVQFNFQKTAKGLDAQFEEFSLDPDPQKHFKTDKDLDYTIVKFNGDPTTKYGKLTFSPTSTKKGDFVNIIQHPAGGPKQIALYHNIVTGAGAKVVQYLTDTLPGSSGSPVFNSAWQVVALHHAGGNLPDPVSNQIAFRNEGIQAAQIKQAFDTLIA